jgi:hypothetical protein
MEKKVKEQRFNRIRGFMMYHLVKAYPGYLDHYEIRCFLDDLGYTITEEELGFHLAYLEEREFVRVESRGDEKTRRDIIFAKADGILLLKGKITDPAIDVESLP